jgi:hypothetical protein
VYKKTDLYVSIAIVVFFVWLIFFIAKQEPMPPPKIDPYKFIPTMPSLTKIEPYNLTAAMLMPPKIETFKFTAIKLSPPKIELSKFSPARMPWIKI